MEKPNYDLSEIPQGQIFQISPEGEDTVCMEYGGDFLVGKVYEDWGVQGYLALVGEHPGLVRFKGDAHLRVRWELLQFVGSCYWFKDVKDEDQTTPQP